MPISILDYIGVEFESADLVREHVNLPDNLRGLFKRDHDASIETPVKIDSSGTVYMYDTQTVKTNPVKIGTEFVSVPLPFNNVDSTVRKLVAFLRENGERSVAERCGIHFHISMAYNLFILKNLVRLSRNMEQVFYYAGSFGQEFRGIKNDCTYCRPITKFGPSIVRNNDMYTQVYNVDDLLKTEDTRQFFDYYGGMNEQNPPGKYHPARYGWITLYPLLTKGTVEFRVFNHTLEPVYLTAAAELSRTFCAICFNTLPELEENSIYSEHTKEGVLKTLETFYHVSNDILNGSGLSQKSFDILSIIITNSPEIKLEPKYYHTHLRNSTFTGFNNYNPRRIPEEQCCRPNFVDVHAFER